MGGAEGTKVGLPTLPVEFGAERARPTLTRQPPRVGEHNAEVLAEAGFGEAEIARLAAGGVIVSAA
jgi:crotonobetainyl-CoA:carnitine CoA-transferase CaiB-like acyl-CoA transferase